VAAALAIPALQAHAAFRRLAALAAYVIRNHIPFPGDAKGAMALLYTPILQGTLVSLAGSFLLVCFGKLFQF
jgi:hypothetical protein